MCLLSVTNKFSEHYVSTNLHTSQQLQKDWLHKVYQNPSSCIQQIILPHNINIGPLWSPWSTYKDIYANIKFIFKCFILPMQSANNKMYNVVTYLMCKTKMRIILLVTKSIYQYNLRLCRTYLTKKKLYFKNSWFLYLWIIRI